MGAGGVVSNSGLTVLVTNLILNGRSGTEIAARNLALALRDLGHRPIVYSPRLGPIAEELRSSAICVVDNLHESLPPIDVIHGHHLPATVTAIARCPDTPAIFVCHDFVAWHDSPPHFPAIRRYVAVDETVASRLRAEGADPARISVILNQPDLARFAPGRELSPRPRRALAFAKNHGHLEAIRRACGERDIDLDIAGSAVGRILDAPEQALEGVDLVFTSALSALEAMACGRGVIVCDGRGLAGWVSPARYDEWRPLNFGLATLRAPVTVESVLGEIDRYSVEDAGLVADRVRSEGGVNAQARQYSAVYAAALADDTWRENIASSRATLARYVEGWSPPGSHLRAWLEERAHLLSELGAGLIAGRAVADVDYAFGQPGSDRHIQPMSGLSRFDGASRWTDGASALFVLRAPAAGSWLLRLRLVPFLHPLHRSQRVGLEVNGLTLVERTFEGDEPGDPVAVFATIPADRVPDDGLLWIRLTLPDAVGPAALGINEDSRKLAVSLIDLRVTAA